MRSNHRVTSKTRITSRTRTWCRRPTEDLCQCLVHVMKPHSSDCALPFLTLIHLRRDKAPKTIKLARLTSSVLTLGHNLLHKPIQSSNCPAFHSTSAAMDFYHCLVTTNIDNEICMPCSPAISDLGKGWIYTRPVPLFFIPALSITHAPPLHSAFVSNISHFLSMEARKLITTRLRLLIANVMIYGSLCRYRLH